MTSLFALWHRAIPAFMDNDRTTLDNFPRGFTLVAYVMAPEVGQVFQLTNHIDSDWTLNPGVTMVVKGKVRSTSVGDVIVADAIDGRNASYTIDGIGLRRF